MNHHLFTAALVGLLLIANGPAGAQSDAPSDAAAIALPVLPDVYVPTVPADDALYRALGSDDGIARIVAEFQRRVNVDPRTAPFFRDADRAYLRAQLAMEICEVAGGPCRREKRNIRRSHSGLDIRMADFNAVVEVLQQAMATEGIAFGAQNRLLAQLAPMYRDIVNVR